MRRLIVLTTFAMGLATPAAAQAPDSIGNGGPALAAVLAAPEGLARDRHGNLYIAERAAHRVRRVDGRTGIITTYAGTGSAGFSGDGGPAAAAALRTPTDLAVDAAGNLYIADTRNNRIRRVDARTRVITTVVGSGEEGFSGDGGPATRAALQGPFGVYFDRNENLFIADTENQRIRRVDRRTGIITTVAGTGEWDFTGDGGPATAASFARPHRFVVTAAGDILVGDSFNQRIRRIDSRTGTITTVAGSGAYGSKGDGGPAIEASITYSGGLALDRDGNLLFTDLASHRVRRIDLKTGVIQTVAGNGQWTFGGDGGPALEASFHLPTAIVVEPDGDMLVADLWNGRIRAIDARTGRMSTMVGSRFTQPSDEVNWHFHYHPDSAKAQLDTPVVGSDAVSSADSRREARIKATDGRVLPLALYLPRERAAAVPAVLLLHGRNNTEFSPIEWGGLASWARLLAGSGMAAVVVSHRLGSQGRSLDLAASDVAAVLEGVRRESKEWGIDPDRIALLTFTGGSALLTPYMADPPAYLRGFAALSPHMVLDAPRLWEWGSETTDARRRFAPRSGLNTRTPPLFVAMGKRDRGMLVDSLATFVATARDRGVMIEVAEHSTGGAHFERFVHDAESRAIVGNVLAFLSGRLEVARKPD